MQGLTPKQTEVLNCVREYNPKILITYGAKRAGKTYIVGILFLAHIAKYEGTGKAFILGGSTKSSIQRNILNDWESLLGIKFKWFEDGHFNLFGCKIYAFGGSKSDSWKAVRGFTATGAFLNEATSLNETYLKECISRCSDDGAVIYMDTNPENPQHFVKTDYIDKDGQTLENGKLNIKAYHFILDDNTAINSEYKESIKKATPAGMFYDRDINGLWVSAEGVIYKAFSNLNLIDPKELKDKIITHYFAGIDFGYQHKGSIVVVGRDNDNNFYIVKEIVEQFKEISWWSEKAQQVKREYGNINFYCDSARPEHVARLQRDGLKAYNANKKVMAGIELTSGLFKQRKLFINTENKGLLKELTLYVWNDKTGEPIKQNDDILDALRYALYSQYMLTPAYFKGLV